MPPEDSTSFDASGDGVPEISALIASLTERVAQLEFTVSQLSLGTEPTVAASQMRLRPTVLSAPPPPMATDLLATAPEVIEPAKPERSLEDRLGSQIFNRIGIVAILIGATWFLKLAMDNHWIGPLGRVLVGLVAGAGLVVWSERFRRREYAAFSYSLKAVGSGVLYLSLWASFQLYHLLPAQMAFLLMLLVTLWNAWMAWAQESELLAAYAIAGGFATPLLLSTGENHQVFLFSYIFAIDSAAIALVRLEAAKSNVWSRLLLGPLAATVGYFIGWFSRFYTADQLTSTSIFIALFFLAFLTVPLRLNRFGPLSHGSGPREADAISDVLVPLGNAVFASLALYFILQDSGYHEALPWMALLFAAIYLAVMRATQTAAARAVHLSLAVLFLTITIPLKASGRWIIIGWLAEGVALLWVSARLAGQAADSASGDRTGLGVHKMLRSLAAFALILGFGGVAALPFWLDDATRTAVFNRRFATEAAGVLALAAAAWISAREMNFEVGKEQGAVTTFPSWGQFAAAAIVALNLVALQAGIIEIETFWGMGPGIGQAYVENGLQTALSISAFLALYGAALLAVGFWKHSAFLRWQALILLIVAILKTFLYDVRSLSQGYRVASFIGLGALLMAVSFAYVRRSAKPTGNP